MKKLLKVALIAICLVSAIDVAQAQVKIGYINFAQLIDQMPETAKVKTDRDAYQKQFMDQLTAMNTEYQQKLTIYQKDRATMTDAVRTAKETELSDLQKRMQTYSNDAQQKVEAKVNELTKPLFDKARGAVALVAKEKGYNYVLDSSQTDLIVSPPADDMLAAVKAKLGLK